MLESLEEGVAPLVPEAISLLFSSSACPLPSYTKSQPPNAVTYQQPEPSAHQSATDTQLDLHSARSSLVQLPVAIKIISWLSLPTPSKIFSWPSLLFKLPALRHRTWQPWTLLCLVVLVKTSPFKLNSRDTNICFPGESLVFYPNFFFLKVLCFTTSNTQSPPYSDFHGLIIGALVISTMATSNYSLQWQSMWSLQ